MPSPFADHKYINLTTFRLSGVPVTTTVWFAEEDGRLYVTTIAQSGKAKRLSNNRNVLITPSTGTGKPLGPEREAEGRILPATEAANAARRLREKYGWLLRIFHWLGSIRGQEYIYLEIRPPGGDTEFTRVDTHEKQSTA